MRFYDLNLRLHFAEPVTSRMIKKSANLGYGAVAISFPMNCERKTVERINEICSKFELEMITRCDLTPRNRGDLLRSLGRYRERFDIMNVRCFSKEVSRQAAKDRRIDMISFPSSNPRKRFFDASEAALASEVSICLEIEMTPLLLLDGLDRIRLISYLRKEIQNAKKHDVPLILTSGASAPHLLRKPTDYGFLAYLVGLDFNSAKKAMSSEPENMIERNRKKSNPNCITVGVRLIDDTDKRVTDD